MRFHVFLGPLISLSLITGIAAAQEVGTVEAIHGGEGEVFVMRGSSSHTLGKGDEIQLHDRLVTKGSGRVTAKAYGCSRTLPAGAMLTVDASFCTATPVSLSGTAVTTTTPALAAPILGGITAGKVVAAGTILSTPAIISTAASDENKGEPVSP